MSQESKLEDIREYVCEHICVHAIEDSDYLIVRCRECKLEQIIRDAEQEQQPAWKKNIMNKFMRRE